MPILKHKTPCKECPFRRVSIPGYLGASNPTEFIESTLHGVDMPCHLDIDYEQEDWETEQLPLAARCAGSLIFLRNNCKLVHENPVLMDAVKQVDRNEDVFSFRQEFVAHHTRQDLDEYLASQGYTPRPKT